MRPTKQKGGGSVKTDVIPPDLKNLPDQVKRIADVYARIVGIRSSVEEISSR